MEHINNVRVVKASKLVDEIIIDDNIKYNPEGVFIDSDLSKSDEQPIIPSKNLISTAPVFLVVFVNISSDFNQLCGLWVGNKSTKTILQTDMISISNKLEVVYVDS